MGDLNDLIVTPRQFADCQSFYPCNCFWKLQHILSKGWPKKNELTYNQYKFNEYVELRPAAIDSYSLTFVTLCTFCYIHYNVLITMHLINIAFIYIAHITHCIYYIVFIKLITLHLLQGIYYIAFIMVLLLN